MCIRDRVTDLIENSFEKDRISMSRTCMTHMELLRDFMFENVYHNRKVKKDEELEKINHILKSLYQYYIENPDQLPEDLRQMVPEFGLEEMVKDHIAGMTERYAVNLYTELFVPKGWK